MEIGGLGPVASGVLTGLATQILVSAPGWTVRRLRGSAEGRAVVAVVAESVGLAFADACADPSGDARWIEAVAREWTPAFTPAVCTRLLSALRSGSGGPVFRAAALDTLHQAGADIAELRRVLDVDEFLYALPRRLFTGLRDAALAPDSALRDVVAALLQQSTAAEVEAALSEASPREFSEDLAGLLAAMESQALRGSMPRFAPPGADIMSLTSGIRVRQGIRSQPGHKDTGEGDRGTADLDPYALPADNMVDERPVTDWKVVAEREDRVVVLGDPGMGKSWLIRWETARLARAAIDALNSSARADDVVLPVPIRCDELAASAESTLADAACCYLAGRYGMPERSQRRLREHVAGGNVMLLLDALDELPGEQARQRLNDLLGHWIAEPGARFRLTSRIAGYTNLPASPSALTEFELQPFTQADVSALISAWGLPEEPLSRLRQYINDSPMANMARIPLLTALLCAAAGSGEDLPESLAGIYERVLRRFLAQENRWPQAPESEPTDIDRLTGILAPLAFHFASRPAGWADRMPSSQIMTVIRSLGSTFTELGQDAAAILRDLSVRAGVLVPAAAQRAGGNPPYLFLHRTIAEFLVAYHLASLPRSEWLDAIHEHLWFDPGWRPVISLLGAAFVLQERPGEAAFLISCLLDEPEDPFHDALLSAARVTAELPGPGILPPDLVGRMAERVMRLLDSEPDRTVAAEFLGHHITRLPWPFTEALLTRLDSEPGGITAQILAHSRDPRVTSRLISLLDDSSNQLYDVFVALRDQDVECFIDEMLTRFDNPALRYRAAEVLRTYAAPRVTERMLKRAGQPDPAARFHALRVIHDRNDPGVLEKLCEFSNAEDPKIRYLAVSGLSFRDNAVAIAVLRSLVEDPDPVVCLIALRGIILGGSKLAEILEFSRSFNVYARSCVARALANYPGSSEAILALKELAGDAEPHVRSCAAEALGSHSGDETAALLIGLLDDQDCAMAASRSLRSYDSPAATKLLLEWVTADPDRDRLIVALRALAGMSSPAATDVLLRCVTNEDDRVREAAAYALAGRRARAVTGDLVRSLGDDSPWVRQAAATALQSCPEDPGLITALLARLSDEDWHVRAAAARTLTISGRYPEVAPALVALLADQNPDVRNAAASKISSANTPAVLLCLCEFAGDPASAGFAIQRDSARQLADRVYRMLPLIERPKVRQRMARLRLAGADPGSGFGRYLSPDIVEEQYLDEEIVMLFQGDNNQDDHVYFYLQTVGRMLRRIFAAMQVGSTWNPADYGFVIFSDKGRPPPYVRRAMNATQNLMDVDIPQPLREPFQI